MNKLFKILITFFVFCIFTFAFIMPLNPIGNWYQQFLPYLGSKQINDIIFLDSLTGFAIASTNVNQDTSSILRTTNGGDNWQIIFTQSSRRFSKIKFANNSTGFISGGSGSGTPYLYKTTDGGNSWSTVPGATLGNAFWDDMSVINVDTIWLTDDNSLNGGVYFTSNGGVSWVQQFSGGNQNPDRIYMLNGTTGFMSKNGGSPNIYRTTNSGINWSINVSGHYMRDMKFADALTGWYSYGNNAYKTTNAGNNWIVQPLPSGGILITVGIDEFSILNRDTVYATGGFAFYGAGQFRGVIYRTINGGNNWLFQVPDTMIHIPQYKFIQFVNNRNGWAFSVGLGGIHTTNGGDTTFLVGVQQVSSQVPKQYELFQNYPNPFNPKTNIKYSVKSQTSNVKLIVFDILGKQIAELVNQKQNAGTYEVDFDGSNLSSGVYFYKLTVTTGKEVFIETKRMVLIK